MTEKQKNIRLLYFCTIALLCCVAVYTLVLSQQSSVSLEYSNSGTVKFALGESKLFPVTSSMDKYLYLEMGSGDTYEISFHCEEDIHTMIVNSGTWATETTADGSVAILHLIPEYIQVSGYSSISAVAIRGDGDYYIHKLSTYGAVAEAPSLHNLIDFEIKKYDITMSEEAYAQITQERKDALNLGILHTDDDSFVSAKITAGGEKFSTDVRLKGDWTDHLLTDQWSYRVEVQGDFAIWGLQKFSLQPVTTRNGIWEYLIYELYREQGGVAIRYDFADVTVNGVYLGVFAVEEFTEKRVIENSLNREGPIIKVNEAPMWVRTTYYPALTAPWEDFGVSSQKKTVASATLNKYASYGITLINKYKNGEESVENVFDVDKFIELSVVLDLFSAYHGRAEHNMRLYYNPVSALLEPIPFDEVSSPGSTNYYFFTDMDSRYDDMGELYQRAMNDIMAMPDKAEYAKNLLLRLAEEMPEYLQRQEETIRQYHTTILRDDEFFYMNAVDIYPRMEQVLSFTSPEEPYYYISNEEGRDVLVLGNPNATAVYLEHLSFDGVSLDYLDYDLLTIRGNEEIILPVDFIGTTVTFTWETLFTQEAKEASLSQDLAFFAIGHAYGDIYHTDGTLHPPVVTYLQELAVGQMDFGLFTGDIRKNFTGSEYPQLIQLANDIKLPFYAIPGNHDLTSFENYSEYTREEQFFQYFDRTFGFDLWGNQLLICLDVYENLESNGSFIPQEQLDMVEYAISRHGNVQNVFVAMHQLLFLELDERDYGGFIPNSLVGYESTGENNFRSHLLPLFDKVDCPVYFITGDTGAFLNGNEIYYEEEGRFTYLSSGVGSWEMDSVLEFYVYSNGAVEIRLRALNDENPSALGRIEDYTRGDNVL